MSNPDSASELFVNDDWDPLGKAFWLRELNAEAEALGAASTNTVTKNMRERQAVWLAAYARRGAKSVACGVAQVTLNASGRWIKEDPIFAKMVPLAKEALADRCAAEITRRAVEGISVTVRDKHGNPIGEERRFSDPLLIQMTKNRQDPENRWAPKDQAGDAIRESWRGAFAGIVRDDPEALKALDMLADRMVGKSEG